MDNLISELFSICKLPFNEIMDDYKIIMISNKSLYLSNYIKILEYSNERIRVLVKKRKEIAFEGTNLKIRQINKSELIISGLINICNLGVSNEK